MGDQDRISLQNTKLLSITWAIYQIDLIFSSKCSRLNQSIHDLTNREALTVLCSVVKHARSALGAKGELRETRAVVECFSPLLECIGKQTAKACVLYLLIRGFSSLLTLQ